jgi:hypothetical protein
MPILDDMLRSAAKQQADVVLLGANLALWTHASSSLLRLFT